MTAPIGLRPLMATSPMLSSGFLEWLRRQEYRVRVELMHALEDNERGVLVHNWYLWARQEQLPPADPDWSTWLICAGRGFGKTRAGAEWVRQAAILDPEARIALVAASLGEARAIMVEGESGVLNICPPNYRPEYEPSLKRLTKPNGATAYLYSAAEPESLRGPQRSHACRASTKRAVRERKPRAHRHVDAPGSGGRGGNSAQFAGSGRVLDRRGRSRRCLDRAGRRHRRLGRRAMDLREPC